MRRDASVLPKASSNSGIFAALALLFFLHLDHPPSCATIFAGCHPCTLTEGALLSGKRRNVWQIGTFLTILMGYTGL